MQGAERMGCHDQDVHYNEIKKQIDCKELWVFTKLKGKALNTTNVMLVLLFLSKLRYMREI